MGKIALRVFADGIEIIDKEQVLQRQHVMALRAFGFKKKPPGNIYTINKSSQDLLMYVSDYLTKSGYDMDSDSATMNELESISKVQENYEIARQKGEQIKHNKSAPPLQPPSFAPSIRIKPYQLPSIHHMIEVTHAANFSVPGSGKTLMTYAAFDMLRDRGDVDSMLVIGPISSFGPWEHEYGFCMGADPRRRILRYHGTNRKNHLGDLQKYDIVLTSYDTASNDSYWLKRHLLQKKKVMMVIDESHHIKSISEDAKHASAMIDLGNHAVRRYILSGTPVPHDFEDLWSQITFLWPSIKILFSRDRYKKMLDNYGVQDEISRRINFLWTRVTNNHLKKDMPPMLPEQQVCVKMSAAQEAIYAAVERDMWRAYEKGTSVSIDLFRFRKNRILRLLQCVSNPHTMLYRDSDYDLDRFRSNNLDTNANLDSYNEIPPKITEAAKRALEITGRNENVVVWTVFVKNVEMLCDEIKKLNPDAKPIGISGDVPTSPNVQSDIPDREARIEQFKQCTNGILVATAGSVAESISLHKTCRNAIYLERNFNAGQYMQSLSRIYRIGSDKKKPVQFVFLKSVFSDGVTETIDDRIGIVLKERIEQMHRLLNDEFILHPLELDTSSRTRAQYGDEETVKIYDDVIDLIREHKSQEKI